MVKPGYLLKWALKTGNCAEEVSKNQLTSNIGNDGYSERWIKRIRIPKANKIRKQRLEFKSIWQQILNNGSKDEETSCT
jgi:hypothetical protein